MRAKAFGVCAALLAAAVTGGCANYREWTLPDGAVLLGDTGGLPIRATFFSVRVGDRWGRRPFHTSAGLRLRGRDLQLSTLSPADLRGLGLEVDSTTHASEGLQTAFVGYGDQNRMAPSSSISPAIGCGSSTPAATRAVTTSSRGRRTGASACRSGSAS